MPFTPPSPDELVEELFTPPPPESLVDYTDHLIGREEPSRILGFHDALQVPGQELAKKLFDKTEYDRHDAFAPPEMSTEDTQKSVLGIDPNQVPNYPGSPLALQLGSAITKTGAGLAQYLTSPQGMTESVAAMTPAAPLVATKWALDMAHGITESIPALVKAIREGDTQEALNQATQTGALAAGLGHMAVSHFRAPEVAPKASEPEPTPAPEPKEENASPIREDTGQPSEVGQAPPSSEVRSGGDLEQTPPREPEPVEQGKETVPEVPGPVPEAKGDVAEPEPLKPDMASARRIADMTPEQFQSEASGFNDLNLKLGENATPKDVSELKQLRDKAQSQSDDAKTKLETEKTESNLNENASANNKVQFFNEAIRTAEAPKVPSIENGGKPNFIAAREITTESPYVVGDYGSYLKSVLSPLRLPENATGLQKFFVGYANFIRSKLRSKFGDVPKSEIERLIKTKGRDRSWLQDQANEIARDSGGVVGKRVETALNGFLDSVESGLRENTDVTDNDFQKFRSKITETSKMVSDLVASVSPRIGPDVQAFDLGIAEKTWGLAHQIVRDAVSVLKPSLADPKTIDRLTSQIMTGESGLGKYQASAKAIADKLRERFKTPDATLSTFGPIPKLIDAAVEIAAKIIEKGGKFADAIDAAVAHIKANHSEEFDEKGFRSEAQLVLGDEPSTTGIAHRVTEVRGVEAERGQGLAPADSVEHGRDLLKSGADPEKAIEDFNKTKAVSADAMALVRARAETLAKETNAAADKFGISSPEFQAAKQAEIDWIAKVKPMQTEWHRTGMAQQGETEIDTGTFHGLRRAQFEATGKEFTPKQEETAKKIAGKVSGAKEAVDKAKQKLFEMLKEPMPPKRSAAEERAQKVSDQTLRNWNVKKAELENKQRVADAKLANDVRKIQEDAAKRAEKSSNQAIQDDAVRRAKEETKKRVEEAERKKALNQIEQDRVQKAIDAGNKRIRDRAVQEAKDAQKDLADPSKKVWDAVRAYTDAGESSLDDIRNKVATDLGLTVKKVTDLLMRNQRAKFLADDAWNKQNDYRRAREQAKRWLKETQIPGYRKALAAIPKILFRSVVGFHGWVALGSHAPTVAFQPPFWKVYVRDFGKMYKMVGNPFSAKGQAAGKAYYESQIQDLIRRPNYIRANRAGLVNDPLVYEEFSSNPAPGKLATMAPKVAEFWDNFSGMGNRGYSILKILRQDMFDQQWDTRPKSAKSDEEAAAIADGINHATGVTKKGAPTGTNLVLFAPRLEASRIAWLAVDPVRALETFATWKTASPAEKLFAINQVKEKAWVAGTLYGLLALNQGFLSASNSDQKINFTDPMKSDFWKFKVAGMQGSYGNAMLSMARLPVRLYAIRESDGGKLKNLVHPDESSYTVLGEYGRSQMSPFAGLASDLWFKSDWQNRPLPNSNRPVPKRLEAQGIKPYTWPEFLSENVLPIPVEEAMREVWKNGMGMSPEQIKSMEKALATISVMSATGARLNDDYSGKPSGPTAEQIRAAYEK